VLEGRAERPALQQPGELPSLRVPGQRRRTGMVASSLMFQPHGHSASMASVGRPIKASRAVVGSRAGGQWRSTTVPSGQSEPQLDSRIRWDEVHHAVYGMQGVMAGIGLAVPARPIRSLAAEDRSAGGIRDQTGPKPDAHEVAHGTRRNTPG
jgi:hypothetical protein